MSTERPDFRVIEADEYRRLHDDPNERLKELEDGMLIEVYGIGRVLEHKKKALNFTAKVELLDKLQKSSIGDFAVKLTVFSAKSFKLLPEHSWEAIVGPEKPHEGSSPLLWAFPRKSLVDFGEYGLLAFGFFGNLSIEDPSELDATYTSLTLERTDNLTLV